MFRLSRSFTKTSLSQIFFLSSAPKAATALSVTDVLIDLTFVDPSGARRSVKGMIGKSLHEVCEMHRIDIGPSSMGAPPEVTRTDSWTEPTFGDGISSGYDHVVLVGKGSDSGVRKTPVEHQMIQDHWDFDEIYGKSRLASTVVLTPEMDGMTIYVPDRIVDDCP